MKIDIDVREFQSALKQYQQATGKDGAEILNRAGRNVAFRASQFTPAASASRIRSGLKSDPRLRYAFTSIALRKRGKGILKSPEFARAVEKFIARRVSSSHYLKAAWAEAIVKMGGNFRGAKFKGASGTASRATLNRLLAELVAITSQPDGAHARSAEDVGIKPLQKAIDFVARDMLDYAEKKLASTARQYSP